MVPAARIRLIDRSRRTSTQIAMAIDVAAIFALGWLAVVGPPGMRLEVTSQDDDRWIIDSVTPGGIAWNNGVRSGMAVIGISPPESSPSGAWSSLAVTDGVAQITVQRHGLPPGQESLVASILALGLAVFSRRVMPSTSWLLSLVPPALASFNGALIVDPPLNLGLELAGVAVGALWLAAVLRLPPGRAALVVLGTCSLFCLGWFVAFGVALEDWVLLRDASLVLSVVFAIAAAASTMASAFARARARSTASPATLSSTAAVGLIADEFIPGRSRTRLTAIERERARLATELHADVLPDLSAVIRSVEDGASAQEAAERLRGIAAELRDLTSARRLSVLERLGLVPALEWLVEQVQGRTGIRVELDVEGASLLAEDRPPREIEVAAFRVCQQALDNALLHARPAKIHVRLDVEAAHAELEVRDDGVGIQAGDERRAVLAGHLGLVDMRQHATAIGAAIQIGPGPGGGTVVLLRWPA